jgi:ADP-ribosylarginine hydrolase
MSEKTASLGERFEASMVLHGVGDALGFKNGDWEFNYSGVSIHNELAKLGGLQNIRINQGKLYEIQKLGA